MTSTTPETPPRQPKRRSRSGCAECRARHRKCDERKPSCANCVKHNKQCDYTVRLSWGGRPFAKSRFGQCLRDPGLVRVPVKNSECKKAFVYSSSGTPEQGQTPVSQETDDEIKRAAMALTSVLDSERKQRKEAHDLPLDEMISMTHANRLFRNPHELSWLSFSQRCLLDHFTSCTTLSLSCHQIVQRDFCNVLIPMALNTSHLLAALLALAATHRLALGLEQRQAQLDFLKCISLQQLRAVLAQPSREISEAIVATTLTLCTADIISDGWRPGSWRHHLQGSAAIIGEHLKHIHDSSAELTSSNNLLWRWYLSIEALSLLCGNLTLSPIPSSRMSLQMRRIINDNEIDDLAGFSTSLIPVFSDINLLALESNQQRFPSNDNNNNNNTLHTRCHNLISTIHTMLSSHNPRFSSLVDASLSPLHKRDFVTLDETFHHVALLHLYRRVLNLPSSSPLVQSSVKHIISRLADMHFMSGPCPGVAVIQPVFTAGCEACEPGERDGIRALLDRIEKRYGSSVVNVRRFLEGLWETRDARGDKEGRMRWDEVMVEMGLDILVY